MRCKKCKIKEREKSSMFCSDCEIKSDYFDDSDINVPAHLVYLKKLLDECYEILDRISCSKMKEKYQGLKLDK